MQFSTDSQFSCLPSRFDQTQIVNFQSAAERPQHKPHGCRALAFAFPSVDLKSALFKTGTVSAHETMEDGKSIAISVPKGRKDSARGFNPGYPTEKSPPPTGTQKAGSHDRI